MLRRGVDEQTGEPLSRALLGERAGWCADLVAAMATGLTAAHWHADDVAALASGQDAAVPLRPDPRSCRDWRWVACPVNLPPTIPPDAVLHLPTVRVVNGKVRADISFTHAVPVARRAGHQVALGVDWGLNTLLSAGAARLNADGAITALGSGAQYRAAGVLAKQHRLRRQGEQLHAKASHYDLLIAGDGRHPLSAKRAILGDEIRQLGERRSSLNDALARSAARWTVDQAIAAGASAKWARCPACSWQGDRDQGAWQRIAARGIAHQAKTVTDRTSGSLVVRSITDDLEARAVVTAPQASRRDRSKTGPTRRRSARPAPKRRRAPSPIGPSGPAGQRPEGHAHTDRLLPRAADRYQGVHAISSTTRRHQPRGAALGAGFHLHAHATPPRWEPAPASVAVVAGSGSLS